MATGLLAKKVGMTQIFTPEGDCVPVTVLEAGPCTVVRRKTAEKDGYDAVVLGWGVVDEKHALPAHEARAGRLQEGRHADLPAPQGGPRQGREGARRPQGRATSSRSTRSSRRTSAST